MQIKKLFNGNSVFVTIDEKQFSYQTQAEDHEAWFFAKKHVDMLRSHGGWFLVRGDEDVKALYLVASGGAWAGGNHPWEYPCWARVGSAYQDSNNYWQDDFQSLSFEDLRDMLFGVSPNLEEL